jgi:hypothetical protein
VTLSDRAAIRARLRSAKGSHTESDQARPRRATERDGRCIRSIREIHANFDQALASGQRRPLSRGLTVPRRTGFGSGVLITTGSLQIQVVTVERFLMVVVA